MPVAGISPRVMSTIPKRPAPPWVAALAIVAGLPLAAYWQTAYPTITWWDSSNYSLAATTLGVTSPPGSLLLTLVGWFVTRVPLGVTPAHILNLLAGVISALTAASVFLVAVRMVRVQDIGDAAPGRVATLGAALGALTFAFSATPWEHAIKFTPYGLTALLTGGILLTLMRWWEVADQPGSWRWLALAALLFGIDFSVHRTNALLIPGAVAWILVRRPRTLLTWRTWLGGAAGLGAGLAVHLLLIPIARLTTSPLNMFAPVDWASFRDYVSLPNTGSGFFVDVWPRNASLWSVQVADFLRTFGDNFAHHSTPVGFAGLLPVLAGIAGLVSLWRRDRRLSVAFTLLLLLHAATTIVCFNIPAQYFRPFDRHYLPVFTTFGVAIAIGISALAQRASLATGGRNLGSTLATGLILLSPLAQLTGNWKAHDASRRYFAMNYALNALAGLPPHAIYFTAGDNDTFPVMYAQSVDGVRPDVRIINLSLANTQWFMHQLRQRDPSLSVLPTQAERRGANAAVWRDTMVTVRVSATAEQLGLPEGTRVPAAVTFRPRPGPGAQPAPADEVVLDIVRTNEFRRPITFAITTGESGLAWLKPWARRDGIFWRIMPVERPQLDPVILRFNLLDRYEYEGYADPSIQLDDVTKVVGSNYYESLRDLLDAERAHGSQALCREAASRFLATLPPRRLGMPASTESDLTTRCGN